MGRQLEHDLTYSFSRRKYARESTKVRHYFTKSEDGEIVVNYEYVNGDRARLSMQRILALTRQTALGACTAPGCQCTTSAADGNGGDRSGSNSVGSESSYGNISSLSTMTNRGSDTPRPALVTAAGMSDGDDSDVFEMDHLQLNEPTAAAPPRPNDDYWRDLGVDSD